MAPGGNESDTPDLQCKPRGDRALGGGFRLLLIAGPGREFSTSQSLNKYLFSEYVVLWGTDYPSTGMDYLVIISRQTPRKRIGKIKTARARNTVQTQLCPLGGLQPWVSYFPKARFPCIPHPPGRSVASLTEELCVNSRWGNAKFNARIRLVLLLLLLSVRLDMACLGSLTPKIKNLG